MSLIYKTSFLLKKFEEGKEKKTFTFKALECAMNKMQKITDTKVFNYRVDHMFGNAVFC